MASYWAGGIGGPSHGVATPETTPSSACTVVTGDEAVDAQPDASAARGNSVMASDRRNDTRIPPSGLQGSVTKYCVRKASGIPDVPFRAHETSASTSSADLAYPANFRRACKHVWQDGHMVAKKTLKTKKAPAKAMSATHKAALAKGREEGRVVRNYLDALEQTKPKRGRKRTPQSIAKRLHVIDVQWSEASALQRLQLTQEGMDLEAELATVEEPIDLAQLESSFVKVAKSYGQRKGISYGAWRIVGVNPAMLKRAGISRAAHS